MFDQNTHHILVSCVCAISFGVLLLVISRRFNIPGIVLLLMGGFLLGPFGAGLVQPELLGNGLRVIASISIGIILFEGGLTLDVRGYLSAPAVIKRLLSIGVLLTWLLTSLTVMLVFQADGGLALVCGSLVIVTGPTVIAPLLRRIRVTSQLRNILHWEGVLIDPIGVFIAVLCFEWIVTASGPTAITNFGLRVVIGLLFGLIGGMAIYYTERHRFVPENMINVFALACAVLIFGITESVISEAGLLSVTVAGFVVGIKKPVALEKIREFKSEITDLLIGTLFILLSARLSPEQFSHFGTQGLLAVAIVMFVIRPISIIACTWGLDIGLREKIFLSWVAPRGVVAASMASLFVLSGQFDTPGTDNRFIETFVYSVIIGTILFQGFTAGLLSRLLGLHDPRRNGWIIVGAHPFARAIAGFIQTTTSSEVILVDTNAGAVSEAEHSGQHAILADARNPDLDELAEHFDIHTVGNLLALTDNEDLNTLVCQNWAQYLGMKNVHRWGTISSTSVSWEPSSGNLVWSDLPKPSLISDALEQGAISIFKMESYSDIVQLEGSSGEGSEIKTPIVSITEENEILLDPHSEVELDRESLSKTLYLKQEVELFS